MLRRTLLPVLLLFLSGCRSSCDDCSAGQCATCPPGSGGDPAQSSGAAGLQVLARGTHSGLSEARRVSIRSSEEWATLWRQHAGDRLPSEPIPQVDFSTQMVLAVVLGERPTAGYDVEILSVTQAEGRLNVRTRENKPAPDLLQAQVITVPFAFAVVPRFEGEVVFSDE